MKTLQRLFLVLSMPLLIVGCGGQEFKYSNSQTGKTHRFLDAKTTNGSIEVLAETDLSPGGYLTGSVQRWLFMAEKEAPIVKTDTIKVTKANPVEASLATLFTIGLYPIFEPTKALEKTVGKSEITRSDETPDYSRARLTGAYRWQERKDSRSEKLTIRIGDRVMEHRFQNASGFKASFNVDISDAIQKMINSKNLLELDIQVSCDCQSNRTSVPSSLLGLTSYSTIKVTRQTHPSFFRQASGLVEKDRPASGQSKQSRPLFKRF
jgi:hypothetical protein